MFYTGAIDYFFDYEFGKLPYRSIRFEYKNYNQKVVQDSAVINFVEKEVDYTRVTEYKYLTGQIVKSTTSSTEFYREDGDPFYPIPTEKNHQQFLKYSNRAKGIKFVIFCGRLAEYQYYNMDQVVAKVIEFSNRIVDD